MKSVNRGCDDCPGAFAEALNSNIVLNTNEMMFVLMCQKTQRYVIDASSCAQQEGDISRVAYARLWPASDAHCDAVHDQ